MVEEYSISVFNKGGVLPLLDLPVLLFLKAELLQLLQDCLIVFQSGRTAIADTAVVVDGVDFRGFKR